MGLEHTSPAVEVDDVPPQDLADLLIDDDVGVLHWLLHLEPNPGRPYGYDVALFVSGARLDDELEQPVPIDRPLVEPLHQGFTGRGVLRGQFQDYHRVVRRLVPKSDEHPITGRGRRGREHPEAIDREVDFNARPRGPCQDQRSLDAP
jgi:hypothetical protein